MAVHRLHFLGFDPADELIQGLVRCGFFLEQGSRILDFGCGDGSFVYRLRDRGFDAHGFDIHNRVMLRSPGDARFFQFSPGDGADSSIMTAPRFTVPFPNAAFDFVFSNQVLEHVIDIHTTLGEVSRVMKPGAISLNIYPSRTALLEAHTFVPLGGVIRARWWYCLWAWIGVANQHQIGKSIQERADENFRYARTGVCYRTDLQMIAEVGNYFPRAWFAEATYYGPRSRHAELRAFLNALRPPGRLRKLAALGRLKVLIMQARP